MADRLFHGKSATYSALRAVEAIAEALSEIKKADRLTFADIGAILGKSEDQAAKYCDGSATMDAVTFGRGKREWGSRFTGYFDRLCHDGVSSEAEDRKSERDVIRAAMALSECLADDNQITPAEVRECRAVLEAAHDAIMRQLNKLRVRAA